MKLYQTIVWLLPSLLHYSACLRHHGNHQADVSTDTPLEDTVDSSLDGVGASFPAEVFESWTAGFESYRSEFVDIDTRYLGIGSGAGNDVARGFDRVDAPGFQPEFFVTDLPLTDEEFENATNLAVAPVLAGPIVLAFNIPGVTSLNLTMDQVAGIFNGTIRWWNDSSLAETNPGLQLPGQLIQKIARADTCGSTMIFTQSLCAYSTAWCSTYGNFSEGIDVNGQHARWEPGVIDLYGRTNRGVSGIILSYQYSIGYLSAADALITLTRFASILRAGVPVNPTLSALSSAINRSIPLLGPRLNTPLVPLVQEGEYPIIGYSYFLVNLNTSTRCNMQVELVRFMEWCFSADFPDDEAREKLMVVVNDEIERMNDETVFKNMWCDGELLHLMVDQQKYDEWLSRQTWRLPVFITAPIVGCAIIALITYMIVQQVRLRRALLSDDWKIESESIQVGWSRSGGLVTNNGPGSAISLNISAISHLSLTVSPHVWGVGNWQDKPVCLRSLIRPIDTNNKEVRKTILWMRYRMLHANVLRLHGVTFMEGNLYIVSDNCPKGTLSDVIQNEKYRIDDNIKFSLALDVASGMQYIHGQGMIHGRLRSDSCFIDSRWQVKISDWEYYRIDEDEMTRKPSQVGPTKEQPKSDDDDPNVVARQNIFCAPEVLCDPDAVPAKAADVYSFAMVMVEIFTREDPFSDELSHMEPTHLVESIVKSGIRPGVDKIEPQSVARIMMKAWQEESEARPTFGQLKKQLKSAKPSKKSVMDSMMEVLEGYVNSLEEKVSERTAELADANKGMENLLHQILPPAVARALSRGDKVDPESFGAVTIYFSDIVGFTKLSAASTPMDIVNMLNDLYITFDSVIENHDVYKVETIGDAYMVISGLPHRNGDFHASHVATMALDLMTAARRFKIRHKPGERLQLRAGIHSGPVVAGVVGVKMPRYCLFGDTVNTASRMESTSEAMRIQVSEPTENYLKNTGQDFELSLRGSIPVKGKGEMKTYFLLEKKGYTPMNPAGNYSFQYLYNE